MRYHSYHMLLVWLLLCEEQWEQVTLQEKVGPLRNGFPSKNPKSCSLSMGSCIVGRAALFAARGLLDWACPIASAVILARCKSEENIFVNRTPAAVRCWPRR